jgi:hypothetical protein
MHYLAAQPAPQDLSPWLLLAAAGAVTLLALLIFWPRLRRRSDPLSRPAEPSLTQQRAVERDMQTLMHDLSELARRVGSQLDARGARLEQLIQEADQRIAQLSAVRPTQSPPMDHPAHEPSLAVFSDAAPTMDVDPRHAEIYALQDQGLTLPEIAARLRRPNGEVELIVALRPRSGATM